MPNVDNSPTYKNYMTKAEFCYNCDERSESHCKDCPLNYLNDDVDDSDDD